MAQVAELCQWQHHYHSLVVWLGMKLCFTIEGKAQWGDGYQLVSACSWWLYSAASLEFQTTGTMACYLTQSHYPNTEATSPCPMLIMPSTWLGNDKYKFVCLWFDSNMGSNPQSPIREINALPIQPVSLVCNWWEDYNKVWLVIYLNRVGRIGHIHSEHFYFVFSTSNFTQNVKS